MGIEVNYLPQLDSSLIFIVGAPRSGTTLVGRILALHPDIFSPGESHYFEDIWSRRDEIGDLEDQISLDKAVTRCLTLYGRFDFPGTQQLIEKNINKTSLIQRVDLCGRNYAGLYYALMSLLAEHFSKQRICDDTPKNLFYLDTINMFFPQAKVIGCLRDPRDFLSSYKHYWKATPTYEMDRMKALYHPILTSILWRSSATSLLKYLDLWNDNKLLLIHYEDLVEAPITEIRRLCNFLEIDYHDEMMMINQHNSSFKPEGEGIYTSSIRRWPKSLDLQEIWLIQKITKNQMSKFNYQIEKSRPSILKLLKILISTPFSLLNALRINTQRRGPWKEYLIRRVTTLFRA